MPDMLFHEDVFNGVEMTAAINKLDFLPQEISSALPWNVESLTQATALIEEIEGTFDIVEARPRNSAPVQIEDDDRVVRPILVPHYPTEFTVMPDEVAGVRAFGSTTALETIEGVRDRKLLKARRSQDVTVEFARAGALQGRILNKNGNVLIDLFETFGVERNEHAIDLEAAGTDVLAELIEAKEKSEDELGAHLVEHYVLPAGPALFKALVQHPSVFKAWERWQDGARFRADNRRGFEIVEGVFLFSYNKGKVRDTRFLPIDEGVLCPVAEGMYESRFAPANHKDFVNTPGLPLYVIPGRTDDYDTGLKAKVESNHAHWLNRPRSAIRIRMS